MIPWLGQQRSSEGLLGRVGDALVQRGEARQQRVPLVLFALPELVVCAVEAVQHAEHPVTLVEPGARKRWQLSHLQVVVGALPHADAYCDLTTRIMLSQQDRRAHLRW